MCRAEWDDRLGVSESFPWNPLSGHTHCSQRRKVRVVMHNTERRPPHKRILEGRVSVLLTRSQIQLLNIDIAIL